MTQVPSVEDRGGDKPDWGKAVAGESLPERQETYPDPDSEQVAAAQELMRLSEELGLYGTGEGEE